LKISDLHLQSGDASYLVVRKGKGGRRRDCYFNGVLTKHLKSYIDYKKKTLRHPTDPDSYLFSRDGKTRYTTTGLHLSFKKALLKAGLPAGKKNRPGLSIHSARHTFATLTLKSTGNLRFMQKQLGHASISMTSLYADILRKIMVSLQGN
jgi:site-specific recombinase XerD